jgi:hypothetical protein
MRELEQAERDCMYAHRRVEAARDHLITVTRAVQGQMQRRQHLRLVRPDQHHRQSA